MLALPARAGDHHSGTTLRCSDCHVMHFSQSHGYDTGRLGNRALGTAPRPYLLRGALNDLCLSCHDGDPTATDVLDAENTGSQMGIVRSAGYLAREGLSSAAHGGHRLDSLDVAPGSSPSWSPASEGGPGVGLTCIHCHDAHGDPGRGHPTGSQYRNLRSDPGFSRGLWITHNPPGGANDRTRDVYVRRPRAYDESMVDWNEPDPKRSALARWCLACHADMHGGRESGGSLRPLGGLLAPLEEHPYEDEDLESEMITRYNSLPVRVKVLSEVGRWWPAGSDVTPSCMSCHRAHGNANPAGLIFRSGTGTPTENGDSGGSSVEHLCAQCHVGGTPD